MIDPGRCRLLHHAPIPENGCPGAWNMAVDEMLLERAALVVPPLGGIPPKGGTTDAPSACVRFYGWCEPTLSLGYFQTYSDRQEHPPSLPCTVVRRLTGGGAILHDAELTYSIVLPGSHPLAARRDELYRAVHGCLIEALGRLGITARWCEAADQIESARPAQLLGKPAFLCFQRRSPGDVLIGRTKVCGSAQRRGAPGTAGHGAVLQHGSLLWRTSPAAPELPGVEDLTNHSVEVEDVAALWLSGMVQRLGPGWQYEDLDITEACRAETLVKTRYSGDDWTKNRGRAGHRSQETL